MAPSPPPLRLRLLPLWFPQRLPPRLPHPRQLIVLEAMKMENEIVATKSGTVAQIAVSKGAVVETGAPLVVIA